MQSCYRTGARRALMASTAAFSLAIGAGITAAQAQTQAQTAEEAVEVEEIVVTGSRIKRAGFDTLQPAVNLGSDFIDDRGFANVADALNEVPAFGIPVDNQGGQSSQNLGQNFANAFGLGSQRTLTLINGRRTVGQNTPTSVGTGAGGGLQVDLNIIPTALIDRVETVFIGGAPIYGTDAIAGTVNIILKNDFEGFSADAQYGIDQRGDAENFRVRGLWGANTSDGKGNVTIAAEYSTVRKVDARDNEIAAQQYGFCENTELGLGGNGLPVTAPNDNIPDFVLCNDSANVWQVPNSGAPLAGNLVSAIRRDANGNPTIASTGSLVNIGGTNLVADGFGGNFKDAAGNSLIFGADGNLITFEQANIGNPRTIFFSQGADGFNNPLIVGLDETNTLISPLDRWIMNGTARYEIAENTSIFLEALYARSESTDTNNQPPWATAFFRGQAQGEIRIDLADNPFVTDEIRNAAIANFNRLDAIEAQRVADFNAENGTSVTPNTINRDAIFVTRSGIDIVQGAPNSRDQDVFRFVAGFEGDLEFLGRDWTWDTAFNFGETNATTRQSELNRVNFALALDAVTDDRVDEDDNPVNPATFGKIVCRSQLEGIPNQFEDIFPTSANPTQRAVDGCTPFNPFGIQEITDAQRAWLIQQNFQATKIRQLTYEGNLAGEVFDLPAGPVSLAGGFIHRREQGRFEVDTASFTGAVNTDAPQVNSAGKFNTTEFYAETLVPVIEKGSDLEVPGISSLQLEGAIRFVDNSRAGNDVTWTAGGRLRPDLPFIEDGLTIRGNFTRSIRAPSVPELFQPVASINTFANDPCDERFIDSGPNPALRAANCQAQVDQLKSIGALPDGFTLDGFRSLIVNRSDLGFTGGNPNLRNEVADSWTVGGVFAPSFLPGFEISIDWTRIQLNDAIITLSGTQLLNACFDSPDFPNAFTCSLFDRENIGSDLFQVVRPELNFLNAARRDFAGLVANFTYNFEASDLVSSMPGTFSLFGNFFHVAKHEQEVAGGDLDILAGERFNERLQFQINLRYNLDRFGFLWQTRHLGSFVFNKQERDDFRPDDQKVAPGVRFHNATLNYQLTDIIGLRAVVNNVFDKRDNGLRAAGRGGNDLNFTDVIGRRFLFSVNANF